MISLFGIGLLILISIPLFAIIWFMVMAVMVRIKTSESTKPRSKVIFYVLSLAFSLLIFLLVTGLIWDAIGSIAR